jgi:hypothetical protein
MKRFIVFMVTASTTLSCFAAGYGELEVPGWLKFLMLLMIAWGILEIILFFKIWGMTNDVRKLTKQFCKEAKTSGPEPKVKPVYNPINPSNYDLGEYDHRLDEVKIGDKVRRESDGKILEVVGIGEKALECRGGMLDGIHSYTKDALSII